MTVLEAVASVSIVFHSVLGVVMIFLARATTFIKVVLGCAYSYGFSAIAPYYFGGVQDVSPVVNRDYKEVIEGREY
jgi:hypothetical protein